MIIRRMLSHANRIRALPVVLVAAAAVACADGPTSVQLTPPAQPWNGFRDIVDTVVFEGSRRVYQMHLPPVYDHETRLDLLLALHGSGENHEQMRAWTGFDALADAHGFVAVYPKAARSGWEEADVAFLRFLIRRLATLWAIDPTEAVVTGFSAGGTMAYRLACQRDLPLGAIATVGSTVAAETGEDCRPGWTRALSVLLMLGDEDRAVPVEGRPGYLSFAESVNLWRAVDFCQAVFDETVEPADPAALPRVRTRRYRLCLPPSEVRAAVLEGVAHEWPREHSNSSGIDVTRIVADFALRRWN